MITQALVQRPEMQAAARQVEMREKELRGEQGGHLPRVNAYASYGINNRTPAFNFNNDNLTMGVSAEVDLFAGGATVARVAGAERKLAEAQAIRERTRLEIEDDVRKAQADLPLSNNWPRHIGMSGFCVRTGRTPAQGQCLRFLWHQQPDPGVQFQQ